MVLRKNAQKCILIKVASVSVPVAQAEHILFFVKPKSPKKSCKFPHQAMKLYAVGSMSWSSKPINCLSAWLPTASRPKRARSSWSGVSRQGFWFSTILLSGSTPSKKLNCCTRFLTSGFLKALLWLPQTVRRKIGSPFFPTRLLAARSWIGSCPERWNSSSPQADHSARKELLEIKFLIQLLNSCFWRWCNYAGTPGELPWPCRGNKMTPDRLSILIGSAYRNILTLDTHKYIGTFIYIFSCIFTSFISF